MELLVTLLEQYGLAFVFLHVLAEQAGLPLPAYPTIIVATALASKADYTVTELVSVAILAAMIADSAWYLGGLRLGRSVLRTLCRISLSPDSCVRQTESIYLRLGAPSLLFAKLVPGFGSVATTLAGTLRTPLALFLLFDTLGAMLWVGIAVSLGILFRDAVNDVLEVLERLGRWGLIAIGVAIALFILLKWWQRRRFYRDLRMARLTVGELHALLDGGAAPVILDVRAPLIQKQDGRIPGAIAIDDGTLEHSLRKLAPSGEVIVYCACPNEASAAKVAKQIMRSGYSRVRPLEGGFDAWVAAGYAVEMGR